MATVVVPTYGRPRQLLSCLEALASQTLPEPWEVIVVDDGSPEPSIAAANAIEPRPGWRPGRRTDVVRSPW